jgi:hypothetical protein
MAGFAGWIWARSMIETRFRLGLFHPHGPGHRHLFFLVVSAESDFGATILFRYLALEISTDPNARVCHPEPRSQRGPQQNLAPS